MASTDQQQPAPVRANRYGHPCPPWCASDHDKELIPGHFYATHSTPTVWLRIGESDAVHVHVSGVLFPSDPQPAVHVSGGAEPLFFMAAQAERTAAMMDLLAAATPAQHRELATAIRQAAAAVFPAPEPECCHCRARIGVFIDHGPGWHHFRGEGTVQSPVELYDAGHEPEVAWQ